MSITTYAELKTAIPVWFMDRSDLSSYADDFIDLAEAYFNKVLRCRQMEATTSLTPSSNVCTLPSDYLEYKRVVEEASTRRALEYITEDAADLLYASRTSGLSNHFMIEGSSLTALPLSSNDIELTYYQALTPLSASATTNWLITAMPNLYLHGSLMQAAEFVNDDAMLARETALTSRYVDILNEADNRAKFGNAGITLTGVIW
jgi:hypothetical protein